MQSKAGRFLVLGGFLFCMALIAQPVLALCGNCGSSVGVFGCYASSNSNNYCFLVRCTAYGDYIGPAQPAYCCFDDMPCAE